MEVERLPRIISKTLDFAGGSIIVSRLKIDEITRTLEVSVREVAEGDGMERIGFERGEGWNRLGLGTELHARVLKERCRTQPGYRTEAYLQAKLAVDDWTAVITGRLDGAVQGQSGEWLIEEFKSGYFQAGEARRSGPGFERHQRQVLYYCHLWRRLGNEPVSGALVYVDLATGREISIAVADEPAEVERDLKRRLARLIAIWRAGEVARMRKAEVASRLPFPHQAPRPGQQQLMAAVTETLRAGENLMAEAPTGSGKTAGVLYPALAHGLASGRQVVFLTSKTLQQRMAVSALTAMNGENAFRTLQIRAKERMCANERVLCHEDFCPYAKNYPQKMEESNLIGRLREGLGHYDPDIVFAQAKREEVCPFEVQLELAQTADAIVADYNYVFEPGVALSHLDGEKPFYLLIDEAHNLPDRARKIFSPEILEETIRALAGRLLLQPGELFEALAHVIDKLVKLLARVAEPLPGGNAIAETEPPTSDLRQLWEEWEPGFVRYLGWKHELKIALAEDPVVDAHFAWHRFMAILNLYGPGFTCVVERRPAGIRLAVVCLDPARALAPVFRTAASTILLSATLSPIDVTRRVLGLKKERTRAISLPPPFPKENRKILILPQVRTAYAARERNFGPIAQLVAAMSDAQQGNTLVLFPSYQFLERVREQMPAPRARLLVQRPNFTEAQRREIFQVLAAPPAEGILLLAVLGGMYAEGVDYPGELLSAVFVVSPALPQVSFERELLRQYFDKTDGDGFEYAYLQPGMTRVIQAAGRLIRSETDRGVIALFCQRFLQEPYVNHLPRDWYEHRPSELIARNPVEEVRRFFARAQ